MRREAKAAAFGSLSPRILPPRAAMVRDVRVHRRRMAASGPGFRCARAGVPEHRTRLVEVLPRSRAPLSPALRAEVVARVQRGFGHPSPVTLRGTGAPIRSLGPKPAEFGRIGRPHAAASEGEAP